MVKKIYVIKGDPTPLARARAGNRRVWDSQKQEKLVAGINLKHQHGSLPFYEGPLHLDVTFFMKIPEQISIRKRETYLHKYHVYKPDTSNLLKFIEDISTGVLYNDDCLIASISTKKVYDSNPRTEFIITKLEPYEK